MRENTIRIISARKANRREQKRYWKQKQKETDS
ncbi:BrnT family toxin [Euhalothece natronophila Z-M001]|uniref:BrnT family toxin n=1 Tax=Euhalothece natronophila Z-M001 TaxID=522448 RepID=A0A5B8NR87_9CHRO|nr:BrnT family toxin [Euhalothece natronophila Z-M001]